MTNFAPNTHSSCLMTPREGARLVGAASARYITLFAIVLPLSTAVTGCAIRYTESSTGLEHVWGIGHMMMRTDTDGHSVAVARGVNTIGISVGSADGGRYFTLGWDRRERVDVVDDSIVCLSWPKGSLMNIRIGSEWSSRLPDATNNVGGCR